MSDILRRHYTRTSPQWHDWQCTPSSAMRFETVIARLHGGPVTVIACSQAQAELLAARSMRAAHNQIPGNPKWRDDVRITFSRVKDLGSAARPAAPRPHWTEQHT